MNQALVSIIVPVYNAAVFLPETFDSLINQTYQPVEIIFVNDGSTDHSESILRRFDERHGHVKYFHQHQKGAASARNAGLERATGEFIKFWDADDLMNPDFIQSQIEVLRNEQDYVASCEWARFIDNTDQAEFLKETVWSDLSSLDWMKRALSQRSDMASSWLWLIPRSVMEKTGKWDERLTLNDDFEFSMRLLKNCKGVKFAKGAKAYYRTGYKQSLAAQTSHQAFKDALLATELGCGHILDLENSDATRVLCANRYQEWAFRIYPKFPDLIKVIEQHIKKLGKSSVKIPGGPVLKGLSVLLGWKFAKRIQLYFYKLGYLNWLEKKGNN